MDRPASPGTIHNRERVRGFRAGELEQTCAIGEARHSVARAPAFPATSCNRHGIPCAVGSDYDPGSLNVAQFVGCDTEVRGYLRTLAVLSGSSAGPSSVSILLDFLHNAVACGTYAFPAGR